MSRLLSAGIALIAVTTLPLAAQEPGSKALTALTRVGVNKARLYALTKIQGNALDSTNGMMSHVPVRLRDARFGRIVDTQVTDMSGLFEFRAIDPGTYIVEIVGNDQSILAASQLLNVNAGEAASAIVKLPLRVPPFAGLVGTTTAQSAAAITSEAMASSIAAIVPTVPVSPNQ